VGYSLAPPPGPLALTISTGEITMTRTTFRLCVWGITPLILLAVASPTNDKLVYAFSYDCVLIYDKPGDLWINLYKEDVHGNKGPSVGSNMHFARGLQFGITPDLNGQNKRMRYDYKTTPNDGMHGNVGFTCINGSTIKL
jgi:hypothetical protein